jgi:hypothetical protein
MAATLLTELSQFFNLTYIEINFGNETSWKLKVGG